MNLPTITTIETSKSGTTLFEQIKSIDNLFGDTEVYKSEKEQWMRRAFELWSDKNSVARSVRKGDTTFTREYQKVFSEYKSFSRLSVPYHLPKDFKEKVHDLEACIGESNLNDSIINKMSGNPVGGFVSGVLLGLMYKGYRAMRSRYSKKDEKPESPSKRMFLKTLGGLGAAGLMYGGSESLSTLGHLSKIEGNAKYLDNTYMKVYNNKK